MTETGVAKHVCKYCNKERVRVQGGQYISRAKKYVDELGRAWNGHTCPECHSQKMLSRMRVARAKAHGLIE